MSIGLRTVLGLQAALGCPGWDRALRETDPTNSGAETRADTTPEREQSHRSEPLTRQSQPLFQLRSERAAESIFNRQQRLHHISAVFRLPTKASIGIQQQDFDSSNEIQECQTQT